MSADLITRFIAADTEVETPAALSNLKHQLDGWVFCATPADAENYGLAVAKRALEAADSVAGVVGAARAGQASGASAKAKLAARNTIIRAWWATMNGRNSVRAREIEKRLHREGAKLAKQLGLEREEVELSARQVLRICDGAASYG
jgi:hypothetical protein